MKSLKILSLVLAVACTSSLFSNENQYRKPFAYVKACVKKCWLKMQGVDREVRGDLFRIPTISSLTREDNSGQRNIFEKWKQWDGQSGRDIEVATKQTWVRVSATSKDSFDWYYGHKDLNNFPGDLPLLFFIDENGKLKKDGDKVRLIHENPKTRERVKVILTLNQKGSRYDWNGGFDGFIKASSSYKELVKPYLGKKSYTNPLSVFHSFVG